MAILVALRVAQGRIVVLDRRGDFPGRTAAHEQRLATPVHHHLLARFDLGEVKLNGGQSQGVARRVNLIDKWPGQSAHGTQRGHTSGDVDKITAVRIIVRGVQFGICAHYGVSHL